MIGSGEPMLPVNHSFSDTSQWQRNIGTGFRRGGGVSIKVLLSSTQILQTAALTDSSFRELIGVITGTLLERMTERMTGWLCDTGI